MIYYDKFWSHVLRNISIVVRPNILNIKFNFENDMIAHKESKHKVSSYKEYTCSAIDQDLVRWCAYWARKGLRVFVDDSYN